MPSNAIYRDEHTNFHRSLKESTPHIELFVREIAENNRTTRKILIHNNICSMAELNQYVAILNRQIVFFKYLNKRFKIILIGMFLGISGYSVYIYQIEYRERLHTFNKSLRANQIQKKENLDLVVIGEYKMPDISQRNIFLPVRNAPQVVQTNTQVKIDELTQNYKIVGIVIDNEVKGIIENIKQQETVFVSLGDKIGEAVIVDILADKIICQLDGFELEILP